MALRQGRDPYKATYGIRDNSASTDYKKLIENERAADYPDKHKLMRLMEAAQMQNLFGGIGSVYNKYQNPY